jgi:hypothetical protein
MSNLGNRLAKIEHDRHSARGVAVVEKHSDESTDTAVARWMVDHPGEPDPRAAPVTVYVTKWAREWQAAGRTKPEGLVA